MEPRVTPVPSTTVGSIVSLLGEEEPGSIELLEGNPDAVVKEVSLVEKMEEIEEIGPQTLVVLGPSLSTQMSGYLLDVAVRRALTHDAPAIAVIVDSERQISTTARSLCRKSELGLLRLHRAKDVNEILHRLLMQLVDELHLTIGRVQRACEAIGTSQTNDPTALADTVSRLLGWQIDVGAAPPGSDGVVAAPVISSEPQGTHFRSTDPNTADARTLLELVLSRMSLQLTGAAMVERSRLQSSSEVLRQIMGGDGGTRDELAPLAERLGIPIDQWHAVLRLEFVDGRGHEIHPPFERREHLARVALAAAKTLGGTWHVAQDPRALLLVFSARNASPGALGPRLQRDAVTIINAVRRPAADFHTYLGIGTARLGPTGMAGSATEAQLAATHARSTRRVDTPISFDAVGIRTTVAEWYGSPTVQRSIDALFAPLDGLPRSRRSGTVEILGAYLDCGGSVSRTAEVMHLHRNAVRARLKRAVELLDVDLDDPDERLFVHLACRSKAITLAPKK